MSDQHTPCPSCGSAAVIPIVYGMPDEDLVRRDAEGLALIGGVAMYDYSPEWHCKDCQHQWRSSITEQTEHGALDDAERALLKAQLDGQDTPQ